MPDTSHKVAVITGAGSGLGRAIALEFFDRGFNLALLDINQRALEEVRSMLSGSGRLVSIHHTDISKEDEVVAARLDILRQHKHVDLLINNAGVFVPKPFVEYTPEDFLNVVSTNLAGFFYVSQAAARHMQQKGGGQIITITTTLAQQPVAGVTAALTSLTKGGLNSVTRGLAIEYVAAGIRVNAIAPGIVDTPMHKPEDHEFLKGLHPIPRLATVQEIVDAALFLARAPFITGQVLYVDGGAQAGKW